ncbi:TonB-linked outer membrane protein, SusC/RagA family [Parapedobacter luteus]|uniref:TonB-linked outer membrane protein, SusC/RagA family n=1 Tax=Parapedobacter luteus TaxID=623280 RepID=A0A1T5DUY3_9SPHI|nr:TonB-dependent receptor [Parapedobacter luteus]SKB75618.1 TonB-linked outer membrane protein, SusC/RagA family [Parapedobacter luteus]
MKTKLFLLYCCVLLVQTLSAQETVITGKVTDQNGLPLDAVSVLTVETNVGAVTNEDGSFRISAAIGQTLRFSMVGAKVEEVKIESLEPLSIQLEVNVALDEVVVTGYQTQRKADLTGAVSVVDVEEMNKQAVANPMKALQGQVPGMYITGSGAPSAPATVRIRGIGTLNNNDPLYIIDGVPTKAGMHELNAADIESMQVLKDASAASIYGSRAANGVIIITTKRGKSGNAQLNVNAYTSASSYTTRAKMLDTDGYGRALWQASVNSNIDPNNSGLPYQFDWRVDPTTNQPVLNSIIIPEFLDADQTMRSSDTDWFDEVSRVGTVQNYDVQVSNGTDRGSYLLSLGYFDNNGIINTTSFNRISARINTDYKLFEDKLTIGQNLSLTKTEEVSADIINTALQALPIIPVHTVDGAGWGGPVQGMNDRHNPVRLLEDNRQNGYDYTRLFGNFFADLKIMENLVFRSNFGIDYGNFFSRNWQKKFRSGYLVGDVNWLNNEQTHNVKTTWTNTLNYMLERNEHRFDMVAGMEFYTESNTHFGARREDFVLEHPDYMYLDAGTGIMTTVGNGARHALLSYFAKANYSYLNKYLLSATIRYDGSSRFGENNRFGLFPAFSAGWRLSEESFIKSNTSLFDDLKLRFGWGVTGNQEIDNHAIFNIYLPNYNATSYDISGNGSGVLPSGFYLTQNANPNLRWEATQMSNIGLDFSLLNQSLYGSVDYYIKKTSDILLLPPYIGVLGEGGNMWVNGASMENKGFELVLGHRSRINDDLRLDLTANFDVVRNKVTHLPAEVINAYGGDGRGQNILGRTFGSHFGYVADGLFHTQEEVDAHAEQPNKGVGRIRYRDIDGNGIINDLDRTWIGVPLPKFTYGLNAQVNYKKFDFSFFLQGIGPVDVNNQFKLHTDFWSAVESSSNKGSRLLNAWSPSNPNSDIPALSLTDDNWEARFSTYFIENGTYLKLRNVQFGYTFDQKLLSRIKLQALRVYVGGDNLGILLRSKSFTGVDPESPAFGYPNPMVLTGGINFRF